MSDAGFLKEIMAHAELKDGVLKSKETKTEKKLFRAMQITFRGGSNLLLTNSKGMLHRYEACVYDQAAPEAKISGEMISWQVQHLEKQFRVETSDLDSNSHIVTKRSLFIRRLDDILGVELVAYLDRTIEDKRIKSDSWRAD
ncbi:MAG: hypothetical protein O9256_00815 [Rhizobiaceae bacterium]|nr:hypothetical protein [Rhizobiaceae bacterium]